MDAFVFLIMSSSQQRPFLGVNKQLDNEVANRF